MSLGRWVLGCVVLFGCSARIGGTSATDAAVAETGIVMPGVDVPIAVDTGNPVDVAQSEDAGITPPVDVPIDRGAPPDGAAPAGQTYDYVISALTIDNSMTAPNQGARGYNLDQRITGAAPSSPLDCDKADYFSSLDADQNMGTCTAGQANGGASCRGGVDNQLPVVAETVSGLVSGSDFGALIQEQISEGRLAIVVRVEGVNGEPGPTLNDESVNVSVFPSAHPMFANCASIGQPGQRYAVEPDSVNGNALAMPRFALRGRIINGRLQTDPLDPTAPGPGLLSLGVGAAAPPIPMRALALRFDLGAASGRNGNLGGMWLLNDLIQGFINSGTLPAGIDPATVRGILAGFVDIATDAQGVPGRGSCTGNDAGAIGVGYGFTLSSIVIDPTVAPRPTSGTCGAGR